ncbi:hypothetical protein VdG1_08880 [Verticillium dahliae VDG1]|nr:hypothetical protein VdG1_08880 [Verticillium dahliae VDG1]
MRKEVNELNAAPVAREMKVLSVGLPRTGSYSICLALTALGYRNVYHGLHAIDSPEDFEVFGRAADALFPSLPSYNGNGMTAKDWDAVFGSCEAVTDLAGPFAESLIASYPDAKVIIVIRDYDKWHKSFVDMLSGIFGRVTMFIKNYLEPWTGDHSATNVQKMMLGWTRSNDLGDLVSRTRELYDRHNDGIQRLVPAEQLLVYKLGDGWQPLCEFLGRDIPEVPFPHGNEAAELRRTIINKQLRVFRAAAIKLGPYVIGAAVIGGAAWMGISA